MFDDQRYFIVINDMHYIAHSACIHNLLQCSTTHEIFFDNQNLDVQMYLGTAVPLLEGSSHQRLPRPSYQTRFKCSEIHVVKYN